MEKKYTKLLRSNEFKGSRKKTFLALGIYLLFILIQLTLAFLLQLNLPWHFFFFYQLVENLPFLSSIIALDSLQEKNCVFSSRHFQTTDPALP
jgi:hypothetical protein